MRFPSLVFHREEQVFEAFSQVHSTTEPGTPGVPVLQGHRFTHPQALPEEPGRRLIIKNQTQVAVHYQHRGVDCSQESAKPLLRQERGCSQPVGRRLVFRKNPVAMLHDGLRLWGYSFGGFLLPEFPARWLWALWPAVLGNCLHVQLYHIDPASADETQRHTQRVQTAKSKRPS